MRTRHLRPTEAALMLALLTAGCEQTFEPFQAGEQTFSVFGFLDVSSDRQWIRVSPMRRSILTPPAPLNATVTLEHLGTGKTVVLADSLLRFPGAVGEEGGATFAHSFWTDEPIDPGASYRLSVVRSDGASAVAVVPMPDTLTKVVVGIRNGLPNSGYVRFGEVEHVAMVQVLYNMPADCGGAFDFWPVYQPLPEPSNPEFHQVPVSRGVGAGSLPCPVASIEIRIVASGSAWPSAAAFNTSALAVPEAPSNITNAVGFLGGVSTKRVPFETCTLMRPPPGQAHCELTYDARTATLVGTVVNADCDDLPRPLALRLEEDFDDRAAPYRVRPVTSRANGTFRISGLEPGVRYVLHAGGGTGGPYLPYTDTFVFEPAQTATTHVAMRRNFGFNLIDGSLCP